jgi:hypothetical protein
MRRKSRHTGRSDAAGTGAFALTDYAAQWNYLLPGPLNLGLEPAVSQVRMTRQGGFDSTIQKVFGLFEVCGLFHRYARLKRHRDRCEPVAEFITCGFNTHHLLGTISRNQVHRVAEKILIAPMVEAT